MSTINAIFLADSHLGYDYPLKPRSIRIRRGEDFFGNFEFVLDTAIKSKPDFLIHGGDVFDSPYVNQSIINRAFFKFLEVAEAGIPVFIVPGNHERAKLPLSLFLQHPNIHIFSEARTVQIKCQDQWVAISGFPYYYEGIRLNFSAILSKLKVDIKKKGLKIMCMHQAIEGAKVGHHNYTFRANKDTLKVEDLTKDYHCYLSGHIHRYQFIKNLKNNRIFIYPGSIERTSFQESGELKGFCTLKFIKTGESYKVQHKFIELDTRPMETIIFEDRLYPIEELCELISSKVKEIPSNSILRYQSEYPENLFKITSKLENELIPNSISIQKGIWTPGKGYKRNRKKREN